MLYKRTSSSPSPRQRLCTGNGALAEEVDKPTSAGTGTAQLVERLTENARRNIDSGSSPRYGKRYPGKTTQISRKGQRGIEEETKSALTPPLYGARSLNMYSHEKLDVAPSVAPSETEHTSRCQDSDKEEDFNTVSFNQRVLNSPKALQATAQEWNRVHIF